MRGVPEISVDIWLLEGVIPVSKLLKMGWLDVCEAFEEVDFIGPVGDKDRSRNIL